MYIIYMPMRACMCAGDQRSRGAAAVPGPASEHALGPGLLRHGFRLGLGHL